MFVALLALVLSAQPVSSADPSRESAARFKALFMRGERLYLKGDLGAAIWNFKQADAIKSTPEVAFDLARAYQKLGEPAYSTYYYRLYLRRAPGAEDALLVAELIGEALGRAEVSGRGFLEMESKEPAVLTVDGRRFDESPVAVFLSPGEHVLTAEYESGTVRKTVLILTGKTASVTLAPAPPPPGPVAVSPRTEASAPQAVAATPRTGARATQGVAVTSRTEASAFQGGAPHPSAEPRSQLPTAALPEVRHTQTAGGTRQSLHRASIAAGAVGGGALIVGAALGLIARGQEAHYRETRTTLTRSEAEGALSSLNSNAQAASVLMVGGGALLGAGAAMFVFTLPQPGER